MSTILISLLVNFFFFEIPFVQSDGSQIKSLAEKLKSKDVRIKLKTLEEIASLGKAGEPLAYDVCNMLLDKSAAIQRQAASTIEKIRPDLHKTIVDFWFDESSFVKLQALRNFQKMGTDAGPIYHVLHTSVVSSLKENTYNGRIVVFPFTELGIAAMKSIQPDKTDAINILFSIASRNNKNSSSRLWAFEKIKKEGLSNKDQVVKLIGAVVDSLNDELIINDCIEFLGSLGSKAESTVPSLQQYKLHKDQYTRDLVYKAIDNIQNNRVADGPKPDLLNDKPSIKMPKNENPPLQNPANIPVKLKTERTVYVNKSYKTKYYKIDDDLWFEIEIESKLPRHTYIEKARTDDYVELHKIKDGEKIRLQSRNVIWWSKKQQWEGHSDGYFEK